MLQYLGLKPQAITYQSALQMYIKKTEIQAWTQINLTPPFPKRFARHCFRLLAAVGNEATLFALDNFRNQSLLENLLSAQPLELPRHGAST